jgi:hypothetical protein
VALFYGVHSPFYLLGSPSPRALRKGRSPYPIDYGERIGCWINVGCRMFGMGDMLKGSVSTAGSKEDALFNVDEILLLRFALHLAYLQEESHGH